MAMVPWGDYRAFEESFGVPVEQGGDGPPRYGTDIGKLLRDNLAFRDSRDEVGLQLVDVLAAIMTRALNGSLGDDGWKQLGHLMVRTDHTVWLVRLAPDAPKRKAVPLNDEGAARVVLALQANMKGMLRDPEGYSE